MPQSDSLADQLKRALEAIEALTRENKILREELASLKRGVFGRRSERLEPGQLGFFDTAPSTLPNEPAPVAPKPKKQGHGRAPFPPELLREVVELDVVEADRLCTCCGKPMKRIGEEVTERGHMIPARLMVKRYVRPKYACPDGHEMTTASLPDGVIEGGKYEASVYAHIATAKYADHLPLHRWRASSSATTCASPSRACGTCSCAWTSWSLSPC